MFEKHIARIKDRVVNVSKEEVTRAAKEIVEEVQAEAATYIPFLKLCGTLVGCTYALKTWVRPTVPSPKITYKMYGETHIHP